MLNRVIRLNEILTEQYIRKLNGLYRITSNYQEKSYNIVKHNFEGNTYKKEVIRENLTLAQAIDYIEFLLDVLEIER